MADKDDKKTPQKPALPGDKQMPLVEAKGAAPVKESKPVVAAAPTEPIDGPDNDYGVEPLPPNADGSARMERDERVYAAKEKHDATVAAKKLADATKADAEQPAAKKDDAAKKDGEQPKPPKKPGETDAPAGTVLAADEPFEIEPGAKWTRKQIADTLIARREQIETLSTQANKYKETFGYDADKAAEVWGPWLKELAETKDLFPYLETARDHFYRRQADPEFARFMDESAANYEAWLKTDEGAKHASTVKKIEYPNYKGGEGKEPDPNSALSKQVAQLQAERAAEVEAAQIKEWAERITVERTNLQTEYPWIAKPYRWNMIVDHALNVSNQQKAEHAAGTRKDPPSYTLTDSVRDMWDAVSEWWELDNASATEARKKSQTALRSSGGSGSVDTSRREGAQTQEGEQSFAGKGGTEAAIAAYLKEHPTPVE